MFRQLTTVRNYSFSEVSSAMQKAIRRGDVKAAGYWAIELHASGYRDYVWRRLMIISAEDCYGAITQEIVALRTAWKEINTQNKEKGKIFVAKAVLLLCMAPKSREADHLLFFGYEQNIATTDGELLAQLEATRSEPYMPIPDYAYDVHTNEGKRRGKTKRDFFKDEQAALKGRVPGLFDNLIESA